MLNLGQHLMFCMNPVDHEISWGSWDHALCSSVVVTTSFGEFLKHNHDYFLDCCYQSFVGMSPAQGLSGESTILILICVILLYLSYRIQHASWVEQWNFMFSVFVGQKICCVFPQGLSPCLIHSRLCPHMPCTIFMRVLGVSYLLMRTTILV